MLQICRATLALLTATLVTIGSQTAEIKPLNELPNPAKDGSVKFFIEDMESTTIEHSGAEGVGVDSDGNVYGAVVRRQMLEKHILK